MQTASELYGRWSTLEEERLFWEDLTTTHNITMSVAGLSVLGNPLWRIDIGKKDAPTILMVAGVHGRELSGREALMIWARDKVPGLSSYFANHRVVIIPNSNPDADSMFTRNNANNVNLNRDYYHLTQPETRSVKRVIKDVNPQIIMDFHDVDTSLDGGADWRPYPAGIPGLYSGLQSLADSSIAFAKNKATLKGYTSLDYERSLISWSTLSASAGSHHAIGLLSEPSFRIPMVARIDLGISFADSIVEWHATNQSAIASAINTSKANSISGAQDIYVPDEWRLTNELLISDLGTYTSSWYNLEELCTLQGIVISPNGTISTRQSNRSMIAILFDSRSSDRLTDQVWSPDFKPNESIDQSKPLYIKDGSVIKRVTNIFIKENNVVRRIKSGTTKEANVITKFFQV